MFKLSALVAGAAAFVASPTPAARTTARQAVAVLDPPVRARAARAARRAAAARAQRATRPSSPQVLDVAAAPATRSIGITVDGVFVLGAGPRPRTRAPLSEYSSRAAEAALLSRDAPSPCAGAATLDEAGQGVWHAHDSEATHYHAFAGDAARHGHEGTFHEHDGVWHSH